MTPQRLTVFLAVAAALTAALKPGWIDTVAVASLLPLAWARARRELPRGFFRDPVFLGLTAFAGVVLLQALLGRSAPATLGAVGRAAAFWGLGKFLALSYPHRLLRGWQVFALGILVLGGGSWLLLQIGLLAPPGLNFDSIPRAALFFGIAFLAALAPCLAANHLPPWGPTLLLALLLVSTGRRATLVAVTVAALIWVRRPLHAVAVGSIAVAMATAVLLSGQAGRFMEGFSLHSPSTYERVAVWSAASHLFVEHPLLGCGFKTFKTKASPHVEAFRAAHPAAHTPERLDDAHNLVLHLAAETGILGLGAILAAFIAPLAAIWRHRADPTAALLGSLGILLLLHLQLHMHLFSGNVAAITFTILGQTTGLLAARTNEATP